MGFVSNLWYLLNVLRIPETFLYLGRCHFSWRMKEKLEIHGLAPALAVRDVQRIAVPQYIHIFLKTVAEFILYSMHFCFGHVEGGSIAVTCLVRI